MSHLQLVTDALQGNYNPEQEFIARVGLDWIAILIRKNLDYGGSVFKRPILGPEMEVDSAIRVRMSDKIQRLMTLLAGNKAHVNDESLEDTFKDLGAYCLLRAVAMQMQGGVEPDVDVEFPLKDSEKLASFKKIDTADNFVEVTQIVNLICYAYDWTFEGTTSYEPKERKWFVFVDGQRVEARGSALDLISALLQKTRVTMITKPNQSELI
jgi:hypothetical protein